jgi:excisionase family DNA binding protein
MAKPRSLPVDSDFLPRKRAAALVGCSPQLLDRLIRRQELKAYRLGSKLVVIRRSDLIALLERHPL